jgi:hypothetical protein
MPQPLLHLGNVRVMRERIGRRSSTQRMHAETVHIGVDAHECAVMPDNLLINGSWMQVFGENLCDVILHRTKQRPIEILFMFCGFEILSDQTLRFETHRDVAHFVAFAMDPKMQHAFTLLQITHAKLTQFLTTQPVVQALN